MDLATENNSFSLLVYEEVPEKTDLYLIPNRVFAEHPEWRELMRSAHNRYINSHEENEGMRFLNAALVSEEHIEDDSHFDDGCVTKRVGKDLVREKVREPVPNAWRCVLAKYKINNENPIVNIHITEVVVSGFFL